MKKLSFFHTPFFVQKCIFIRFLRELSVFPLLREKRRICYDKEKYCCLFSGYGKVFEKIREAIEADER